MAGANLLAIKDWITTNKGSKEDFDGLMELVFGHILEQTQIYTGENLINKTSIDSFDDNYLSEVIKYMKQYSFSKTAFLKIFNQVFNYDNYTFLDIKAFMNGFRFKNYLYTGEIQIGGSPIPIVPMINPIDDIFDTEVDDDFSLFGNPFSDSTKAWKLSTRIFVFNVDDSMVRAIYGNVYGSGGVSYNVPYAYIGGSGDKLGIRFSSSGGITETENVNIFAFPIDRYSWNKWVRIDLEWEPSTSTFTASLYNIVDELIDTKSASNIEYTLGSTSNTYFGFGNNGHRSDRYGSNLVYDLENTYWTINGIITWGYDVMNHEGVSV